ILANPRGFCAGVTRAIKTVNKALSLHGAPVYVRHEIVHNTTVVNEFKQKGVIFVENVDEVPGGSVFIISAHGAAVKVFEKADQKNLKIIDATCPLVKAVHNFVNRQKKKNIPVILIGHKGHPEVEGTIGQTNYNKIHVIKNKSEIDFLPFTRNQELACITQTTLSKYDVEEILAELKKNFVNIKAPQKGGVCYATFNRQRAVIDIIRKIDLLLVIGSANSSNSNRLQELGEKYHTESYLINTYHNINKAWFNGKKSIGITSGASAPEHLVQECINYIQSFFPHSAVTEYKKNKEKITFSLPEIEFSK
ncbi:MAG TPA: 4-hydroxy-3-methylbut-2-enyl diphosphate reductase, partial [Spirochaetota bacterium]|nr:4-hydroxy-3-methylbut-2-enyl diphosphate reductase [Spirochaetota bacterium]